ncbi:MAG: hypothetical protein AAGF12_21755 [Myxococcota bacterium]
MASTRLGTGDVLDLEVEALLPPGDGQSGRFRVRGAFPGEQVEARVDHVGKNASFATAITIVEGRAARRPAPCPQHREREGRCTGCPLMTLEESDQRFLLTQMLASEYGLHVDKVEAAPSSLGYRWSATRVAFGGPGRVRLGSFIRGTHQPADMTGCLVDHPRIAEAADEVAAVARELGVITHDERTSRPGLRGVWLRTNRESPDDQAMVLVTLVSSNPDPNVLRPLAERLTHADGVAFSIHGGPGNNLRGEGAEPLLGVAALEVDGVPIGPLGFLQPNAAVAEHMYAWLVDGLEGRVFDLYAGSGFTTRRLIRQGCEVVPCESHPESAAALGTPPQPVEAFLGAVDAPPDAVVANPPRKGLGAFVVEQLRELRAPRLHIMACGPRGLAEDLRGLEPDYRLESLRAFDTLPQTPHLELVAKLVLRKAVRSPRPDEI